MRSGPRNPEGVKMDVQSKARLVETPPSAERGVTATLSRSDIEETLKSADGSALLVLDIARRRGDEGDVEAHTLEVELEKPDLEEILRTATGEAIELRFDGTELEQALDSDVDAHGIRQKALILSVAAATAAGVAGQARAMPVVESGGASSAVAAPISDVVSGGPAAAQAAGAQFASDVVSGGPAGAQASQSELAAAMTGGAEWPREAAAASQEQTPLVSDVSGGGPAGAQAAESQFASDVVSGGPATAPSSVEAAGGGGGITISSADAEAAAVGAGLMLLITGAGITAIRRQKPPTPA
jgi:hypothetical protein